MDEKPIRVFVDASSDGRICIHSEELGYTIQKLDEVYDTYHVKSMEAEYFAVIRAIEILDPGKYYILTDCQGIVDPINNEKHEPKKKWVKHKIRKIRRILRSRGDIEIKLFYVPRELNKAGLRLDGVNPDIEYYIKQKESHINYIPRVH